MRERGKRQKRVFCMYVVSVCVCVCVCVCVWEEGVTKLHLVMLIILWFFFLSWIYQKFSLIKKI